MRTIAHLLIAAGLAPSAAHAGADWFAIPSLSIAQRYDDNLYSTPTQPVDDRVLQASPALEAGAESFRSSLRARYSFDSESYAEHPDLNEDRARERATLDVQHDATRATTLTAAAIWARTNRPGEFNPEIGVESGRASAESISVGSGLTHRVDPLNVGFATYVYVRDRLAGRPGTDTHTATLDVDRRLSRQVTALAGYTFRAFAFEEQGDVVAHSLWLGATREFTPRTSATLKGGPRFSEGAVDPEAMASVLYRLEPGDVSLAYRRVLTTAVGQSGTVTTEALEATASRPVGRALELRASAHWASSARGTAHADVRRVNAEASYRISEVMSLVGSLQSSVQRGSLDAPGGASIDRNVLMVGVVFSGRRPRAAQPDPEDAAPGIPRDEARPRPGGAGT